MTVAKVLDRHMVGRQFIVGDRFTAADCVTAYIIDWAADKKLLDDLPHLKLYISWLHQRTNSPPDFAEARIRLEAAKP